MSEAPEHAQQPWPLDPEQSRRTVEEDRAWAQLYASVGQAATAEDVVRQLDADAEAKRKHLALYLRARTTLREQRAAEARNQRIGAFVRSTVTLLVIGPFRLLRSVLSSSTHAAVEMLPPVRRDPAKGRVRSLTRDPEFAQAAQRFTASVEATAPAAEQNEESRRAKTA